MKNFKSLTQTTIKKATFIFNGIEYLYDYYFEMDKDYFDFQEVIITNLETDEQVESGTQLYHDLKSFAETILNQSMSKYEKL